MFPFVLNETCSFFKSNLSNPCRQHEDPAIRERAGDAVATRGNDAGAQWRDGREFDSEAEQSVVAESNEIHGPGPQPSFAQQQRHLAQQLAPRQNHPTGAEGDKGAGRGVLHVRDTVGTVLRAESGAGFLSRLRASDRPQDLRPGHLARLCQLHGEPDLLHDLQQGLPPGLQKGAAVQIPQSRLAASQVGPEPRETGDHHQQDVRRAWKWKIRSRYRW